MPTRKELIDQVRADQRARSARTRADNPKSAIVGIGDRDPLTGLYEVLLLDGSVEMGEKQFNSSLPKGSQVLGVPQSTGGWLLDERDVQPIKPIPQPSPRGKVKTLHSRIEGGERVFYLWGDRPKPKRIGSIPANAQSVRAKLDNLSSDLWIMGLKWFDTDYHNQSFGSYKSNEINSTGEQLELLGVGGITYVGHGFWWGRKYARIDRLPPPPIVFNVTTNYSFYKGQVISSVGSVDLTLVLNAGSFIENSIVESFLTPISPVLTRPYLSEQLNIYQPPGTGTQYYKSPNPVAVSKDVQFSLYSESVKEAQSNQIVKTYKLATSSTEITLGGNLPNFEDIATNSNLIGNRYFEVKLPPALIDQPQWDIDIYNLGTNTTKSTIKTKVTYKHKTGMTFHSASYHP